MDGCSPNRPRLGDVKKMLNKCKNNYKCIITIKPIFLTIKRKYDLMNCTSRGYYGVLRSWAEAGRGGGGGLATSRPASPGPGTSRPVL